MSTTPNLAVTELAPGQSSKDVTVNTGLEDLDNAIAGSIDIDCSAGGTITLTRPQWLNSVLHLTGSPGAGFNLVVPTNKKIYVVDNASGETATVKTPSGTGTAVSTASVQLVRSDGTNVVAINIASSSGGGLTLSGEVTGPSTSNQVSSIARLVETEQDDGTVSANTSISFATKSFHKISTSTSGLTYTLGTTGVSNGQVVEVRSYITGAVAAGPLWATSSGAIKWTAGSAPVSSVAAGTVDVLRLKFDGTNWIELSRSMGCS
jgi:hypothetical protein